MRKTSFPSIWDARVPSSTLGGTIFSFQNVADFLTLGLVLIQHSSSSIRFPASCFEATLSVIALQ